MKLGTTELIVILLVVVIIFGPTQIPKLTKMFGRSIRGFREGMEADEGEKGSEAVSNAGHEDI